MSNIKYIIDKNNEFKLSYYRANMVGLDVTPKNGAKGVSIKAKKVILVDKDLTNEFIKKRINKKLDKVISFILQILNDEDSSESDASLVIDEIHRLKGILINKYKEYMVVSEYKAMISKLIILEEEFKKNYNQKVFRANYINSLYHDEIKEGRGR